jgi:hypothetical protein
VAQELFQAAMAAYALSFALSAISKDGSGIPGYLCAWWTFSPTLLNRRFFEMLTLWTVAFAICGWINVAFLASLAIRWL